MSSLATDIQESTEVYLVLRGEWRDICGVFTAREKADAWIKFNNPRNYYDYEIIGTKVVR